MKLIETKIPDLLLVHYKAIIDERGSFREVWNEAQVEAEHGLRHRWVQDNESTSEIGVLRGLHYQSSPYAQAKLVRVTKGAIWDVAIDLRKDSETFMKHEGFILSDLNGDALLIPRGFAHGFIALSKATVHYKVDSVRVPDSERVIAWNDPALDIAWPLLGEPMLSDKDRVAGPYFET